MNSQTRRRLVPSAPCALLLLPVLLLLPGGCQEANGGDGLLGEPGLVDLTRRVEEALAKGPGIILPEPVPVILLTTDEARERRKAYNAANADETGLSVAVDFFADALFGNRMLGRYLPDEKVVYVLEDVLRSEGRGDDEAAMELLFPVLAHELVHAYDDQVYGCVPSPSQMGDLLEDPRNLIGFQTQMSLIEGRATFISGLACDAVGVEPLPEPTVEGARQATLLRSDGTFGGDVLAGLGNNMGRLKFLQYAYGVRFSREAHRFGGEAFFQHVFDNLPLSMEELEDFSLFVVRWAETMEEQELEEETSEDA